MVTSRNIGQWDMYEPGVRVKGLGCRSKLGSNQHIDDMKSHQAGWNQALVHGSRTKPRAL